MAKDLYGICTWTLGIKDLQQLMQTIAGLGLNAVQFCECMDAHLPQDVLAVAKANRLQIIMYDPFYCKAIDYAAALKVGQNLRALSSWTQHCANDVESWHCMIQILKQISIYAAKKEVPLSFKLCNFYEVPYIHTFAEFKRLVEACGCEHISVILDSFHMNISEASPFQILQEHGHQCSVFHISGSNREGMAQGHLDFKAYHDALYGGGFKGPCVMEFVLKTNRVNQPPQNQAELAELSRQVRQSLMIWKGFKEKKAASFSL